jgi:hypothetical protein
MGAATLVPVEEYLNTSYPDREYVDGEVVERDLGEKTHAHFRGILSSTSALDVRNGNNGFT